MVNILMLMALMLAVRRGSIQVMMLGLTDL